MATFRDLTDAPVDEDLIPPEDYYQQRASAAAYQLEHDNVTDPTIRARLERDLAYWRTALSRSTVEQHWDAGEGDRRLF